MPSRANNQPIGRQEEMKTRIVLRNRVLPSVPGDGSPLISPSGPGFAMVFQHTSGDVAEWQTRTVQVRVPERA
jgi:hypothetical protein